MNEIDGSNKARSYPDAGEMRAKAEYVMKIGMLLESGRMSKPEAAQKLGLSGEELSEILHGKFRDLTVAKISEYLDLLVGERK
ncbi:hypothetical protein C5612_24340 [Pseudomonas frederiksbergensis]|uniref:HigA2-like helix-turn-helix domain-containing protein n=1 Tax=Pseudomonas frederiksbergensis TaxID=104087 RepID=A0A2S8HC34_9PSED|nr:XRE family transcriptional regulator [Pseudomonas frederiksbergensis]PQP00077.1 hypothetical protein C5612_24340 [Pseudomonas frederiksbergensis]